MAEDKILRCTECGINFLWTAEEQSGHGPAPGLCPMCRHLAPRSGLRRGTVKWFNRSKGYGFITGTDGSEIFLHKSGLAGGQALPRAGQLVEFGLTTGPRGLQAADARVLELPDSQESAHAV